MCFEVCHSVNEWMRGFEGCWCIAGGWAIDLYLDKQTRAHDDIEIMIFREDQQILKHHLNDWEICKVEEGELSTWGHEHLKLPIHELHATHKATGQKLEILLNEKDEENWIFRRDSRVTKPLNEIINFSINSLPYLKPEIVLLYKAKSIGSKDVHDFNEAVSVMDDDQKKWLKEALKIHLPQLLDGAACPGNCCL
ncbi:hypothetical protein J4760_12070 [Salinicoccus sp. ID82-1]|uniref:nucleotidyltransferase domain-containing protein n=1 Tax=Salinicoccus sp. ID82-1 TaxID=2820269 RepID=UPI001F18D3E7|nr:hypothetical protein [Salinicoccus sp. ID82-1]MCG1010756.1 hypothetical protein [Salinicoccus sp. ID82-1]